MTHFKVSKSMRDLRSLADPRDYREDPFCSPPAPEYRRGGDRNRPTSNVAGDPGALSAWCEAEGLDAPAVMGLAMWRAVRLWYRSTSQTAARDALTLLVANCTKRLKNEPTREFSTADFHAVSIASTQWQLAGRPLFNLTCADAQRTMIGLRTVALRSGQ